MTNIPNMNTISYKKCLNKALVLILVTIISVGTLFPMVANADFIDYLNPFSSNNPTSPLNWFSGGSNNGAGGSNAAGSNLVNDTPVICGTTPAPDYDSGWVTTGGDYTFTHNLGASVQVSVTWQQKNGTLHNTPFSSFDNGKQRSFNWSVNSRSVITAEQNMYEGFDIAQVRVKVWRTDRTCPAAQPSTVNNVNSNNNIVNSNFNSPGSTVNAQGATAVVANAAMPYYTPVPYPNPNPNPNPNPYPQQSLDASCYSNYSSASTNDTIVWNASAWGGNGSYSYFWSGTDGLSGGGSSISRVYYNPGGKSATVTVTSGNQTVTRTCVNAVTIYSYNNNYNYNNYTYNNPYPYNYNYNYTTYNNDIGVSCYPDSTYIATGQTVTWRANVTNNYYGSYYYSWNGTDGLYYTGTSVVSQTYNTPGTKTASVTISTPNNQTITRYCGSVQVQDGYYNNYNYNYNNGNYYNGTLNATCAANVTTATPGTDVIWTVYPTGGTGTYTHSWTGTDGLGTYHNAYQNTLTARYSETGTKYATVTVTSGNQSIVRLCTNSVLVGYTPAAAATPRYYSRQPAETVASAKQPLDVVCMPNTGAAQTNDNVVWTAQVTGGTGSTYSYSWNGSDGLFGLSNTAFKTYNTPGMKLAAVTVTSGKDTITRQCLTAVAINDVNQNPNQNQNQNLSAASKNALDQIPWGLVSVLIILILVGSLIYVLATRPPRA